MPIIVHIGAFDPDVETFRSYESRIKQYFEANAIPDGRQRAALISTIGAQGYKTLQDLFAPNDPVRSLLLTCSQHCVTITC